AVRGIHFRFFFAEFETCLSAFFGGRKASCNDSAKQQVLVRSSMDVGSFREGVVCCALWSRTAYYLCGRRCFVPCGVGYATLPNSSIVRWYGLHMLPNLASTWIGIVFVFSEQL
ncbi:unnamed protein product, partial [Ectocarpus sp. 12 AP-2014]